SRIVHVLGGVALLALMACSKSNDGSTSEAPAATDDKTTTTEAVADNAGGGAIGASQAKEIFKSRCATCHGNEGRGDGPGAIALNPKPRNYHDKDWQAKVTDDD